MNPKITLSSMREAHHVYKLKCPMVRKILIPQGITSFRETFIASGQVPSRVIVGFISQAAHDGSYQANPFHFQHYNATQVLIQVIDRYYPLQEISKSEFAHNLYLKPFRALCDSMGKFQTNKPLAITYQEYGAGFTLFGFDLTREHQASLLDVQRQTGSVTLYVEFGHDLNRAIYAVIYEEYVKDLILDHYNHPSFPV